MNGVHDMGGMHGFGPVKPEEDEPVFHEPWEGRLYAMVRSMGRHNPFGHRGMRFNLESLPPAQYLASSYYERWMTVLEQAAVEKGFFDLEELDSKREFFTQNPESQPSRRDDPDAVKRVKEVAFTHRSPNRADVDVAPKFLPGDSVRAQNINPSGHTRLPRYIRGKRGVINKLHGIHNFDDSRSQGLGEQPQPVYSVRFEGPELWGDAAETNSSVYIDMWESYLNRA